MYKLFAVFATGSGPRTFRFVSNDRAEFVRIGYEFMYVAPGLVRLIDGDLLLTVTGHRIGRPGTWVEYCGFRVFFTDDEPSAEAAAKAVSEASATRAA